MEFMLIAAALNLQVIYPDNETCNLALETVKEQDMNAFCIPAGKDKQDEIFDRFAIMIERLRNLESNNK